MSSSTQWIVFVRKYALVIIALGIIGFLSNPEKATTSLMFASGPGVLFYIATYLASQKKALSCKRFCIAITVYSILVGVRVLMVLCSVLQGASGKVFPAIILGYISLFGFWTVRKCISSE